MMVLSMGCVDQQDHGVAHSDTHTKKTVLYFEMET